MLPDLNLKLLHQRGNKLFLLQQNNLLLYDIELKEFIFNLEFDDIKITLLISDDKHFYYYSNDGKIYCIALQTLTKVYDFYPGGLVNAMLVDDGKLYISTYSHQLFGIHIHDLVTGKGILTKFFIFPLKLIKIIDNKLYILSHKIMYINLLNNYQIKEINGYLGLKCLDVNNELLVSSCSDGVINFQDRKDLNMISTIKINADIINIQILNDVVYFLVSNQSKSLYSIDSDLVINLISSGVDKFLIG